MEAKKISFGFSKLSKKISIIPNNIKKDEKKVDLIECLEGQAIKVKDVVEEIKQPLVIPIKDNQKNLLDRIRDAKKSQKPLDQPKTEPEDNRPDSELSIDELAARQLLREAKDRLAKRHITNTNKVSVLPLSNETPSLEGEKEPTIEDYESVPISDYGFALLRGMGWKEGMAIGKNTSKTASVSVPELRPKGLGLGATKVVLSEIPAKKPVDKDGKELALVKGAYAKLIAGGKKGNYCEVQGFDEEAGRVIVKVYPKGENLNINEFMLIPVTKEEFSKGSKILNNAKYEEYLEISDKKLENYKIKQEHSKSKGSKEYAQRSDSEDHDQGKTKNKKYDKNSSVTDDKKSSHSRQKDLDIKRKNRRRSSDSEDERKTSRSHTKSKYRDRSRSNSLPRHRSQKDKNQRHYDSSSDSEYYDKEMKSSKNSKSKERDRSRDRNRQKHKKDKTHKNKARRDSSSSDTDSKRDKRKKNKCKSRHRRNSSSGSDDRSYRNKK